MTHNRKTLLVIDDDRLFCDAIAAYFHKYLIDVAIANTGEQGVSWCRKNRADVVLLDQKLPDNSGTELCATLLSLHDQTKIIFITAFPSFDNAVQALRNGAHDYLSKPLELDEIKLAVDLAFRTVELEQVEQVQEFHYHKDSEKTKLLGIDGGLAPIKDLIERAATNRAPVLLTGETGTGKTVVAKTIHYLRGGRQQPFIDINCATLPENLIESELFGYEKGAFTGADTRKKGLFEMADGGTLFLDEIGEMPLQLQSKLLGVLDSGKFRRLGGQTECTTDVRIIAATNVNPEQAIAEKRFRQDLYYRLSVMHIHLPPLRQRIEDIADLVNHFLSVIAPDKHLGIAAEELASLEGYDWPGNVRELRNIIERAVILCNGQQVCPSELLHHTAADSRVQQQVDPKEEQMAVIPLAELEKQHIRHALTVCCNNRTKAAKALGIARSTLIRKLEQYHL